MSLISDLLRSKYTTARRLAGITGKITSMGIVCGTVTKLMTKSCHVAIMERTRWDSFFRIDERVLQELQFWLNNLKDLNVRHLNVNHKYNRVVFSDASKSGCGGYVVDIRGSVCYRSWVEAESSYSSTWRECMGVITVLNSVSHLLKDQVVKWYSDNQGVIKIVENGSMKPDLQILALKIYQFCVKNHITLQMEWLPRNLNIQADQISKVIDYDDWSITKDFFKYIDSLWGKHTIDCFASFTNNKIDRFYSKYWTPGCSGVDGFAFGWHQDICWLVPPPNLIAKTINKILSDKTKGTLVVPYWTSAAYWPLLVTHYGKFKAFIKHYILVERGSDILVSGTVKSIFGPQFKGSIYMLKIDAT